MTDEVFDTIVGVKVKPKYMSIINEVTHALPGGIG